jgi:hypothetical protein
MFKIFRNSDLASDIGNKRLGNDSWVFEVNLTLFMKDNSTKMLYMCKITYGAIYFTNSPFLFLLSDVRSVGKVLWPWNKRSSRNLKL